MTAASQMNDPVGFDPVGWVGELGGDDERALLGLDDWKDALVGAIRLLSEDRVRVRTVTMRDRYVFVMSFMGNDVYHRARFDHAMREWPLPRYHAGPDGGSRYGLADADYARRRAYLSRCLAQVFRDPMSLAATLRDGSYETPEHRGFLLPLVRAWWAERLAEGCDPETARMMLGLTVSSSTWRMLSFPADGGLPSLCAA